MRGEIEIKLTDLCTKCIGRGQITRASFSAPNKPITKPCETCHSTGQEPTEFGRELLQFLKTYGAAQPRAERETKDV